MIFGIAGPVNIVQLTAELEKATGKVGTLATAGDLTTAGGSVWSSQWTDAEIKTALGAITYAAPVPTARESARSTVTQMATTIPANVAQAKADAATIAGITAGSPLTAAEVTAMTNHANGWVTLLEGLGALLQAQAP